MTAADPLFFSHPLPIVTTLYPSGFALEIATDSAAVVSAASQVWGSYPKLFDVPAVRLRIAVASVPAEVQPKPSMPRGQENLVAIIHGPENFAVADLARGFAFVGLSPDVVSKSGYVAHHFLEPLAYVLLAAKHITILHAACIALNGHSVILAGESGAGKTCLAYACARLGWTFLSGDTIQFARGSDNGMVIGRPFSIRFRQDARELFPELCGYAAKLGFNGKTDIEPPLTDLNVATSLQARAGPVVFLNRSAAVRTSSLRPVCPDEALRSMAQAIIFGDEQLRSKQREALAGFMQGRPAFDLMYSNMTDAESVLRSLITETV